MEEKVYSLTVDLGIPIDVDKVKIDYEGVSPAKKDGTVVTITPTGQIYFTLHY